MDLEKKNKKKIKPIEIFYEAQKTYSLTIAPSDYNQGFNDKTYMVKIYRYSVDYIDRLKNVTTKLNEILLPYNRDIQYILHTDISEPRDINGNIPRIHFHGVIRFKTNDKILKWLLSILPQLSTFGIVNIDTIDDMNHWEKYCKKYDHITNTPPLKNKMEWRNKYNNEDG